MVTSQRVRMTMSGLFALLFSGSLFASVALAQSDSATSAGREQTRPWDRQINSAATQADAWFESYKFRSGETLGIKHLHAILGMSMGGMNAWQWAEAYPDMMDGVMPVVSLPVNVSGRNILWRRMVIDAIRSDPEWKDGNYTQAPSGWLFGYQVLRLMIDGAGRYQATIPDTAAADAFIGELRNQAACTDANDVLYSLKSSADYDPAPGLSSIKTKLFALNFSDDEFNPDELHILQDLMPKVKNGRFVVQAGTKTSPGHLTMTRPDLWANHVGDFMHWLGDTPQRAEK